MTSHRAMVTSPARDSRGPDVSPRTSKPAALPAETRANLGPAPAARPPATPAAPCPGVDRRPVEAAQRYLAPALKAAAAARARTAHIRAAAAGAARPAPQEWLVPAPDHSPAALTLPPMPTEGAKMAEIMAAWTSHGLSVAAAIAPPPAPPPRPAAPASRGLSVAEAARASRIPFRPLRREPPARPAGPPSSRRAAADAAIPAAAGKTAAAAQTTASTAASTAASPASAALETVPPAAAAKPVTRPGAARLLPGEAVRRAVPERAARQQRFAKTMAELQRHQTATRPDEPWGNVVPRPAVPQSNPPTSDSRWSRLWSRR